MGKSYFCTFSRKPQNAKRETAKIKLGKTRIIHSLSTHSVCYQKLEYMHNNPLRKGFVEKPEDWVQSSASNYAVGDHSILKVDLLHMI